MNPFEDINDNTIIKKESKIEIWVEVNGRKKNTYVSGWNITEDQLKDHLKTIKKKNGCNGTIKEIPNSSGTELITVMQFQGNHSDYMYDYLISQQVDSTSITIRG